MLTPEERDLIETRLDELAARHPADHGPVLDRLDMFRLHHRRSKYAIGRRPSGRRPSHAETSELLENWARACGDVELYALRPYAMWHEIRLGRAPAADVTRRLAAAPSFEEFSRRTRSGEG